ncbi:Na+-transporting NADH:ubiquinone oxidoreductase subunit D [Porphyromonas canoris]|uniref:RnfABCDGE type electron transport complex subunit D n=1 Tax=Porphyromonas canoris TaxID=36875 RepID=UPI00051D34BE|nr:RnfABCDGE type electron transport complex subunit D [Porphyromonas canoris]KGL53625.1 Na+-transporting NADH:ubiquinone oxidoreductase subunit D [Porphyromonas canoris]
MDNKFLVSPSPHIHSGDSIEKNMYGVIIALTPALLASFYFFGLGAVVVTIASVLGCVATEYLINKYLLRRDELTITDGSAILTGLLLALNLPSNLPVWIILVGAFIAIGIGKMSFGGLGCNIFNPALLGRVVLLISFPVQMTSWPKPLQWTQYIDVESGATPLGILKGVKMGIQGNSLDMIPNTLDLLLGQMGGSLGEVSAIALLLGLVYMLAKKIITWHIPVAILGTVAIFAGALYLYDPTVYPTPDVHLLTGGMLLGAIFMATDYVSSPMTKNGMLIYGVCIGLITMLIRVFGSFPEGMSFAILIMNGITPIINLYVKPKHFGGKVAK